MERRRLVATHRVAFAVLTLAAIAAQMGDLVEKGTLNPVSYFSYFTIESNLIAAVVFFIAAARWCSERVSWLDFVRGGAVVYMVVTGVVFSLLLSGTNVDTAIPWVNTVVHAVMPIVVALDWLANPPLTPISIRRSLLWLGYPTVWLAYILVRGALVRLYPYPFLDPTNGGYATVAAYCVGVLILMLFVCTVVAALSHWSIVGRRYPQ